MGVTVTDVYVTLHRFAADRWTVLIRIDDSGVARSLHEEVGPATTCQLALAMIVSYLEDWLEQVQDPFPDGEQLQAWPTGWTGER